MTVEIGHETKIIFNIDYFYYSPPQLRESWPKSNFNLAAMTDLVDGDNLEMRRSFRKFVSDPCMIPRYNIPLAEEREVALKRMQRICDGGFISVLDFRCRKIKI